MPTQTERDLPPEQMCTVGALGSPDKCWPDASYSEMSSELSKYNWWQMRAAKDYFFSFSFFHFQTLGL